MSNFAATTAGINSSDQTNICSEQIEQQDVGGTKCASCGNNFRNCLPCLNHLDKFKIALLLLCLAGIVEGFVAVGLLSVVITTLEQRFYLQSTDTGFIASCYEIGTCFCALFVSYYGGKGSKPKWIGFGMLLFGLGSFIFALPHFLAPPYKKDENLNTCNSELDNEKCFSSTLRNYRWFFILGQLLNGIGSTALFTLGITYIDDNVVKDKSALYQGIFLATSIFGPACGFLVGGQFLTFYINLKESIDISQYSASWIGAWWLGYIIGGILAVLSAFSILCLPNYLSNMEEFRVGTGNENIQCSQTVHQGNQSSRMLSSFGRSLLVIFTSPLYFLAALADALEFGVIAGLTAFGPKYVELMFDVTPSQAAMYFGIAVILGGAFGQFLGGFIVSKAKLQIFGILKFCLVLSACTAISTAFFIISCPEIDFAGATVPYLNQSKKSYNTFLSSCNKFCDCNRDFYEPVCGNDNVTYYSPCHAGCTSTNFTSDAQIYLNCSCTILHGATVKLGKCYTSDCHTLPLFLFLLFVAIVGTFIPSTPTVQIMLRAVPNVQRSFAMGIRAVFIRLLGSIPVPIIFGKVIDLACIVWSSECGIFSTCELYKNDKLSAYIGSLVGSIKVLIIVVFSVALCIYRSPSSSLSPSPPESEVFVGQDSPSEETTILFTCLAYKQGRLPYCFLF